MEPAFQNVINFSGDPAGSPWSPSPSHPKPANDELEDWEDEDDFFAEMLEKGPSEFFVDYIVMPMLGLAAVSVIAMIASGSLWVAVKMGKATLDMLT